MSEAGADLRSRGERPSYGVAALLGSIVVVTGNDTLAKFVTQDLPVSQFVVLRAGIVLVALSLYILATRKLAHLVLRNWPIMALRGFTMAGATWCFLIAIQYLPLADTFALFFTAPLIATALARVLLKEEVGWRRWTAVLTGFLGVVVALLPTGQGYPLWAAALPLVGAFFSATRDLTSRKLTDGETSLGILFYTVVAVFLSGLGGSLGEAWEPIDWQPLSLILVCATLQTAAHYLQIEAYRHAEIALLSPLRYLSLIFAATSGYLVFGDVPTWNLWLGSAIIVGCGLFVAYRERLKAKLKVG